MFSYLQACVDADPVRPGPGGRLTHHVEGRAADGLRHRRLREVPGEPEVGDLEGRIQAGPREQQVLRLEVPVDEVLRPQEVEAGT